MIKNIQNFCRLDREKKKLFLEAYVILLWVRTILKLTSFKYATQDLKQIQNNANIDDTAMTDQAIVANVCEAVKQASGHTWGKNTCLAQTISAQKMLVKRQIGGRLYIGVMKEEKIHKAHAWLAYNGEVMIGEYEYEKHEVMVSYTWDVAS